MKDNNEDLNKLQVLFGGQEGAQVPELLRKLELEWNATVLENYKLREQVEELKTQVASHLFQYDAACRTIARLNAEIKGLESRLTKTESKTDDKSLPGTKTKNVVIPESIMSEVVELSERLIQNRKERNFSGLSKNQLKLSEPCINGSISHESAKLGVYCITSQRNESGSTTIFSGGFDGNVCLTDLEGFGMIQRFTAHRDAVTSISAHPDVEVILTGSKDQTMKLFSRSSGSEWGANNVTRGFGGSVFGCDIHPLGSLGMGMDRNGLVVINDLETGRSLLRKALSPDKRFEDAHFHLDARTMVTCGDELKIWDIRSLTEALVFDSNEAHSLIKSLPNGYLFASLTQSGEIQFWDSRKGSKVPVTVSVDEGAQQHLGIDVASNSLSLATVAMGKQETFTKLVTLSGSGKSRTVMSSPSIKEELTEGLPSIGNIHWLKHSDQKFLTYSKEVNTVKVWDLAI